MDGHNVTRRVHGRVNRRAALTSLTGAVTGLAALGATPAAARSGGEGWVDTWTAMPQLTEPHNLPPAPFTGSDGVLADATLRQTVHLTIGARRVRLSFSNEFGGAPLPLTSVAVALPAGGRAGARAVVPGSTLPVTFDGRASVTVPVGARYVSDPVDVRVPPGGELTVTVHLVEGQRSLSVTSHPGSRTTSHLVAGERVAAEDLPGATPVDHWYFLSAVEAWAARGSRAVAVLGDSLTDGRGSTTNGNDRWPDRLAARLRERRDTHDVAVLNQGAGGNRVLLEGLGPSAVSRLDRDVFARSGVTRLIVFEGVNDIGTAAATAAAQEAVTADLVAAYGQFVTRAHAQGVAVYGATLTPFGGNAAYDDPAGLREAARREVNAWIRGSGRFDAVLDFDAAVRDPARPERLRDTVHDGDWLHLTPGGYALLAAAVPVSLFRD